MIGRSVGELAVGQAAELIREVTPGLVRAFLAATGDDNPLHSDPTFAAATRFGGLVVPGMLTGSLISAVIGTRLPGPGTVYVSQELRFRRPVAVGDVVTARVEVIQLVPERNRVCLRTTCTNQHGELVLEGEAWVLPPRARVEYQGPGARSPVALAWAPATLGARLASAWAMRACALAREALDLVRRAPPAAPASA
ncbi:MAG: MaoC family dehydratase [Armatimonadota bacterium]|nr:MaoC family dehydratase [Armatimonadota bacterium]MDR7492274.1 MaoC family dehydratase [Armatimonadota bacterium]MDR7593214.1 MaoC family dehydratase [Armatimonadota bacterium]